MNNLVKILSSDDGEPREEDLKNWHFVIISCGDPCTLCEGEYFGAGQSGCDFETKQVKRGGITCPKCIEMIKMFKSVKL